MKKRVYQGQIAQGKNRGRMLTFFSPTMRCDRDPVDSVMMRIRSLWVMVMAPMAFVLIRPVFLTRHSRTGTADFESTEAPDLVRFALSLQRGDRRRRHRTNPWFGWRFRSGTCRYDAGIRREGCCYQKRGMLQS